ncbi:PE domain-containing protein [Actinophytocola sp.]|uniref:PE domain-containing protein n=1 Tax=Actinophytocola sp. TaxID=1872138 RepID=UPI00389ADFD1
MAGKDGGGAQNDILLVDPDAVPGLRGAYADALARVDRQLELADKELRVASWAQDPVSLGAAKVFNDRALDGEDDAVGLLRYYREQLDAAVQNLDATAAQYKKTDEDVSGASAGQG